MKKYLITLFCSAFCCFAQSDSIVFFPKDTEPILKPIIHQVDLSSKISEMNDTTELVSNNKGKREFKSIQQVINKNITGLQYDYNKRLREKEYGKRNINNKKEILGGKFTVALDILSDGSVSSCKFVESSLNDSLLETSILIRIYKWNFGPIQYENDTTRINYNFVFSQ